MILNRQRRVLISMRLLRNFVVSASRALRLPPQSFTVCLVTDAQIARWNRLYRGKPGPTDVLSFPEVTRETKRKEQATGRKRQPTRRPSLVSRSFLASPGAYLGDIAIAPSVARRNARRFGRTLDDEMRILILHGILHLMGYDHETDTGQMERREQQLRRALGLA